MNARALVVAALVLLLAPTLFPGSAQPPPSPTGGRIFALVMTGYAFNGQSAPNALLLEAYDGEGMQFIVHVPLLFEPHTFHIHGHPWMDPASGVPIDSIVLAPGESNQFQVKAGLAEGRVGDWFYHCHYESHFHHGMWGVLRVYPFSIDAEVAGATWDLNVHKRGAWLDVDDVRLLDAGGDLVPIVFDTPWKGRATVVPPVLADGKYALEVDTVHGTSVARIHVAAGRAEVVRDVLPPDELRGGISDMLGDALDGRIAL